MLYFLLDKAGCIGTRSEKSGLLTDDINRL